MIETALLLIFGGIFAIVGRYCIETLVDIAKSNKYGMSDFFEALYFSIAVIAIFVGICYALLIILGRILG